MASGFDPSARLQSKDGICAYLGHISHAQYDGWRARGIVPGPVTGTNRYDIRQHDHVLDLLAGIIARQQTRKLSPLEEWEAANARAA
ncbi:hypothetical protein [Allosphingosinicella deserti]|uniref:Uncharacterized protein n=1 Tax=Allosphingosinicella deserti TaxID=2116704 RepID=A0A2P7QVY5_9SPHN|nr:hypothetical protein [Sphingomonas deserti]PSJ42131.1 hypothetical protein C7I55_07815 [Sphingomonas deserti]